MKKKVFKISLALVAIFFVLIFCFIVIPPLMDHPDILGAIAGGFVNPFATGFSTDAVCCWVILLILVVYEIPKIKYGWVCLLLGLVPGVAVGFATYLIIRTNQLENEFSYKAN